MASFYLAFGFEAWIFSAIGVVWAYFALKAKRNDRPYLAAVRMTAALIAFGLAAYAIDLGIRIMSA